MEIRTLTTPAEMAALDELAGRIWRTGGASVVPRELLVVLAHTGSYVAGAFEGDRMIGVAVGLLGRDETEGGGRHVPELHSHLVGVLPGARDAGVGVALKLHQRRWALDRGIDLITWTFDPLVRRNAVFNLAKLGASVGAYHVDFYGEMADGVNAGHGSDRWWVRWQLDAPPAVAAASGRWPGRVAPRPGDAVCPLPADIDALRRSTPEEARRWRLEVRGTLTAALAAGRRVIGVDAGGAYVLRGPEAEEPPGLR